MFGRGKFIVFEGIDGSGKSTQIRILADYLESRGIKCYVTKEPTDGPFGSLVHQCMTGRVIADEKSIASLFVADRLDHLYNQNNGLIEKIEAGYTVLCDRYYFSSYAYHGAHMDMGWVIDANRLSAEALRPDINIYIDVDPHESQKRIGQRNARERYEQLDNMIKVRDAYFTAFERLKNQEKIAIVDSYHSCEATAKQIKTITDKLFGFNF